MQKSMEPVAKALGMSTDDLMKALQSGQSMSDLAKAKGVSNDALISAIKQGIKENAPSGAPALSDAQIDTMAKRIASHKGAGGPAHAGGVADGDGTSSTTKAQFEQLLEALSQSLGSNASQQSDLATIATTGGNGVDAWA